MAAEGATKVHVSTIQRLYSLLRGEELDDALDEQSGGDMAPEQPVEVVYNPKVPIESYDVIIVDECHRSIYGVWRQVLEYFDAFFIGLTATPGIQTFAFFEQNLVTEYGHAEAVADRVNVDFDVFRIRTEITEGGGTVRAGFVTKFRDRLTRGERLERIDAEVDYDAAELESQGGGVRSDPHRRGDAAGLAAGDVPRPQAARRGPSREHPQDIDLRQGRQPRR